MPIQYSLAERGNPGRPTAPKKLYAVARSQGDTTVRDLANHINAMSTVSTIDVLAVLEGLFQTVPAQLADGHIVRLGDFGSFAVSLQGEGAAMAADFHHGLVTKVNVVFRPGKLFEQAMQQAELHRVSTVLPDSQARATRRRR